MVITVKDVLVNLSHYEMALTVCMHIIRQLDDVELCLEYMNLTKQLHSKLFNSRQHGSDADAKLPSCYFFAEENALLQYLGSVRA